MNIFSTIPVRLATALTLVAAPLTAQLDVTGRVAGNGIAAGYTGWNERADRGTPIDPTLDVHFYGSHHNTTARMVARRFSNGFSADATLIPPVNFLSPGVVGTMAFEIAATQNVSGSLVVEMDTSDWGASELRMLRSPVGARNFGGPTPIRLSIPMTLTTRAPLEFELDLGINFGANIAPNQLTFRSNVRVVFVVDVPPIPPPPAPGCTILPYGSSCASLTGTVLPIGRTATLQVTSNRPNMFGTIVFGHTRQLVATPTKGCFELLVHQPLIPSLSFRTDAQGNASTSFRLPPVGSTLLVQARIGWTSRFGYRSSNGLEVICR